MDFYNIPEIKDFINNGGLIIKHPYLDRYLVKGRKEDINKIKDKVDIIVCTEENIYKEEELENVLEDLSEKYKIKVVLYSFHPLLVSFLFITNNPNSIDIDDIIRTIISRTSIVRGFISINGENCVPFSKEIVMERKKEEIDNERVITEDDILNLRILLNTAKSFEELIKKL